ncbi:MAG: error-prone DNA polymerase [Terriglobales bacterium]
MPENLIKTCADLNMPAMALLDRNGVYGAPRFYMAAKKVGIKAHMGAEVTCEQFSRLPLLVQSRAGYQNLCRLITKMKLRTSKKTSKAANLGAKEEGAVRENELQEYAAGLICLTGAEDGPLAAALAHGGMQEAKRCVQRLTNIFGVGNVYVELQRHFHREQEARNRAAIEIAHSLRLPLLATNNVHYATAYEREICDVFTALRHHRTLNDAGRLLTRNSERFLKSAKQMHQLFADLPEAIANSVELSSRLQFTLKDLGYEFPKYPVPDGESMMSFLRERTREGFQRRYGRTDTAADFIASDLKTRARNQIERELKLIEKLDLAGYFLIVWDLVRFCREQNILVQGRGSAANSAVCYSLEITAVDPVGMELLFERFLSEERGEWPDIDLDLPSGDQREQVIQYLYKRYGERGAAMTANVITYRSRMASREMGKVLGFDPETLDKVSAAVSHWEYRDANDTFDHRFRDAGLDLNHPRLRKYFELCVAVQDLPRHLGQHSGGMVICQGQLDSVVPLEPASMPGRVVVQWDKDDCNDLGIIKVDLLGLGMMAVLEDSLTLIRNHYDEEVDLAHLPADDPEVYSTLQKADTIGMFQIESRAQMSCLPRLRPQHFYDIVVQVAIIRPGPIVGQMVNPYLQRRQGREPVHYPHPSLEPVLKRTLGVPLFQEQLLRIAMVAANFSGGEAEELRRAMGFKRSQARMKEIEAKLRAGMELNGLSHEAQEQIVLSITSFALYGFPESHAASFALLAYASAYLKCHYLAAFTAALLNNQPMGFYHPATVVKDAQRHGLKALPIDVMKSDWLCTLEETSSDQASGIGRVNKAEPKLRIGLRYVRGLREEAAQNLVRQRSIAPFHSIRELVHRVPELRKDELNTLAAIGALNGIHSNDEHYISAKLHRRNALWQVESAVRPAGPLLDQSYESDEESPLPAMNEEERLVADFRGTGMTVGPHPMAYHRARMQKMGIHRAIDLANVPNGIYLRIGGCVIARQRPGTAKGFVFLSIEDETGVANAIINPALFEKNRLMVGSEQFLMIEGILQNQDNVISVKANRVQRLLITRAETSSHDFH